MTESEGRALARTTLVLLVAAAVRWGVTVRREPPLVPADSAAALPGLLQESRLERDEAARREAPLAEGERLDPNLASEIDLDRLPGVGPASARAIVEAREAGGGFARPEDLLRVRGIGPATLQRALPHLAFPAGAGLASTAALGVSGPSASTPAPPAPAAPIDLNDATAVELQRLPGIGPALAGRILEARERRGGFRRVEDLLEVRGIGPVVLERIRPLVSVLPLAP